MLLQVTHELKTLEMNEEKASASDQSATKKAKQLEQTLHEVCSLIDVFRLCINHTVLTSRLSLRLKSRTAESTISRPRTTSLTVCSLHSLCIVRVSHVLAVTAELENTRKLYQDAKAELDNALNELVDI